MKLERVRQKELRVETVQRSDETCPYSVHRPTTLKTSPSSACVSPSHAGP